MRYRVLVVAVAGLLTTGCTPPPDNAGDTLGQVEVNHVIDGDTLSVILDGTQERVRILGIDIPEVDPAQPCAAEATQRLSDLTNDQPVTLHHDPDLPERDRYDRILAYVEAADGEDAAQVLLSEGLADIYQAQNHTRADDYRTAAETAAHPPCHSRN